MIIVLANTDAVDLDEFSYQIIDQMLDQKAVKRLYGIGWAIISGITALPSPC